ncbi:MAG: 30S ribosomal protein S4 [Clostridiales bacterium GWE2_32_10]|nr:MAG: 30S ribosomal protein S4 [Clostridiales bacterium GWE2_32_10]HBY21425.1 30S ribosomal protein S4 [Clostridiales bacterium]
MARYIGAKCKLCRREGLKLFLKGERCYTGKCAIDKRPYAPGQHGQKRKKLSEYGVQLREKQKAKRYYGVLEAQFRNYFEKADKEKGITGENLLRLLELRLDNIIYRLGFASSRTESRQIVRHNHVTVNGQKVNIPSCRLKEGDVIEIKEDSKDMTRFKIAKEASEGVVIPEWLERDAKSLKGKVNHVPSRAQINVPIEETLIIELYSK